MNGCLRCSTCGHDWPDSSKYSICPECLERTDRVTNVAAMDADLALSLKNHLDFERFYKKHEADQLAALDGAATAEEAA
jgi:hypothetical protein